MTVMNSAAISTKRVLGSVSLVRSISSTMDPLANSSISTLIAPGMTASEMRVG